MTELTERLRREIVRTVKLDILHQEAADHIEAQAERIRVLEHLVIDAAYTLDKARIWNGMGWTYNPLHPVHYAPMRERLHNECDNIAAIRRRE